MKIWIYLKQFTVFCLNVCRLSIHYTWIMERDRGPLTNEFLSHLIADSTRCSHVEAVRLPVVFFVSLWLFLPDAAMLFHLPSGDDTTANATTSLVILLWNICLTLLLSRHFFTPALWISATTCTTHSPAHFPLCELNKLCLNHQHPIPNATFAYLKVPSDLDVSVHGGGLSSPD